MRKICIWEKYEPTTVGEPFLPKRNYMNMSIVNFLKTHLTHQNLSRPSIFLSSVVIVWPEESLFRSYVDILLGQWCVWGQKSRKGEVVNRVILTMQSCSCYAEDAENNKQVSLFIYACILKKSYSDFLEHFVVCCYHHAGHNRGHCQYRQHLDNMPQLERDNNCQTNSLYYVHYTVRKAQK